MVSAETLLHYNVLTIVEARIYTTSVLAGLSTQKQQLEIFNTCVLKYVLSLQPLKHRDREKIIDIAQATF